jgi:hypothetical protein
MFEPEMGEAVIITGGTTAATRSDGIAASRASNSSNALSNRPIGAIARHFCTICSN